MNVLPLAGLRPAHLHQRCIWVLLSNLWLGIPRTGIKKDHCTKLILSPFSLSSLKQQEGGKLEYLVVLALEGYPFQKIFPCFAVGALTTSSYLQLSVGQGRKQRFFWGWKGSEYDTTHTLRWHPLATECASDGVSATSYSHSITSADTSCTIPWKRPCF